MFSNDLAEIDKRKLGNFKKTIRGHLMSNSLRNKFPQDIIRDFDIFLISVFL